MTRICIFNGDMSRGGGTERITQILANSLAVDPSYEVFVLNLNNSSGSSFYPIDPVVKFCILPSGGILKKNLALRHFLKSQKIDVLINVDIMLGIFSIYPLLRRRTKVISWEMFNLYNDIGSKNTVRMRKLCLRRSAYYITLTKGDMDAFLNEMPVKCPITYIYNPCDPHNDYNNYDEHSKTIVTAGHFFYTKGYDLAIQTAKLVFDRHPDWKWEFYGDGVQFEKMKDLANELGLSKNVIFCGRSSHIEEAYKKASMYVMTSRTEGFGLVLTEAKSYCLPTLSFDIDFGPREIIEDGISGYLIPAFDVVHMADQICKLIEQPELRLLFSQHAKDNLPSFSLEAFIQNWITVIQNVVNRKEE